MPASLRPLRRMLTLAHGGLDQARAIQMSHLTIRFRQSFHQRQQPERQLRGRFQNRAKSLANLSADCADMKAVAINPTWYFHVGLPNLVI
jgi:hypothetical protein